MRTGKKIILGLIGVILIFLMGLTYLYNKPKTIFVLSVKNAYKDLFSLASDINSSKIGKLSKDNVLISKFDIDFDLKLENDDENEKNIADFFNKLKFRIETGNDSLNNKTMVKFISTFEKEEMLNIFYYQLKEKRYLYFKNIYNKFIQLEDALETDKEIDNLEDLKHFLDKIQKLFSESLKDKDFSKTKVELKTGDKTFNTDKITLTLNEKRLRDIMLYILKGLKNDEKSIESFISFYNASNSDLVSKEKLTIITFKEKVDELIKELEETTVESKDELKISVYVKKWLNTVVGYELSFPDKNEFKESSNNVVLNYITYINQDKKVVNEFKMTLDKQTLNFFLIKEGEKKYSYECSFKTEGLPVTVFSGEISLIEEVVKIDQEYKYIGLISLNIQEDEEKVASFKMNLEAQIKIGGKLNDIKVNNVIKQDKISEEDYWKIYNGLLEPFMEKILSIMGFSTDFDDDFQWDEDFEFEWDEDFDFENY